MLVFRTMIFAIFGMILVSGTIQYKQFFFDAISPQWIEFCAKSFHLDSVNNQSIYPANTDITYHEREKENSISSMEQSKVIEVASYEMHKRIHQLNGPLFHITYFAFGKQRPGYILLITSHFLTDAFSNTIFIHDLQTVYTQMIRKRQVTYEYRSAKGYHCRHDFAKPGWGRGDRLGRGLDDQLSISDTGHMYLLEGIHCVFPSQRDTFFIPARYGLADRCASRGFLSLLI